MLIRTRYYAGSATYAFVIVYKNDAILSSIGRSGGTDFYARRFLTLVAHSGQNLFAHLWKSPALGGCYTGPEYTALQEIFLLASHYTCPTTDALR
jgi:hypothetical protein